MAEVSQALPAPTPARRGPGRPRKYIIDESQPLTPESRRILTIRRCHARAYERDREAICQNNCQRQKDLRAKCAENLKLINELKLQLAAAQ